MSNPIEDRLFSTEITLKGLAVSVQQLAGVVNVLDQYMLLNKKFFDQIKVTEPTKPEEPVIIPEIVEPK